MVRRKKRASRRPNAKFYLFIGTIAAAVIVIVFLITNISTETIEQGVIPFEGEFPVVIVRDEKVMSEENYGKANYITPEGTRVEADKAVAEVYTWGYQANVVQELIEKQNNILRYQENQLIGDGKEDAQYGSINESIAAKAADINEIIATGSGDLMAAERELKDLMTQRRDYLNETVAQDKLLEEYFSEEQMLRDRIDSWRKEVTAPQAGVVSYYFDGAEEVLNADNLQQVTSADIDNILNGTVNKPEGTDQTTEQPLYRLVNNFKWYLLIESPRSMIEFQNGTVFDIAFEKFPAKQYQGTVRGSISDENGYIYVVEVLDDIGELLSERRTDAKMFTKFEGLKVSDKAIKEENGVKGVTVVSDGEKRFVPVNIRVEKDGSSIVEASGEGGALAVGDKVAH